MSSFDDRYDNEFPELVVEGEFDEILSEDEFIERSIQENLNEGTPPDYELIHYDRAKQELAIATTVDEVQNIIDRAEALRVYLKQIGENFEIQNQVAEIKIRAQRRAGEIFKDVQREQGKRTDLTSDQVGPKLKKIEKENDISSTTRKRYETIASMSENKFEKWIAEVKDKKEELTTSEILKVIKNRAKESKKEAKKQELVELAHDYIENQAITIIEGDFRDVCKDIEDNSIDLVLTDLPYPAEYLDLWQPLSKISSRVLKPSKFLVCYSGHLHLDKVIKELGKHMVYYWTFALYHTGNTVIVQGRNVIAEWKPILIYQKPPFQKFEDTLPDFVAFDKMAKDNHPWEQGIPAFEFFINHLTKPNDIVLDVAIGSGTTLLAAKKSKRRVIGIDIDQKCIDTVKGRLMKE